jgi:hypothetical protein
MKWPDGSRTNKGSAADKIMRYFQANPDEELSVADVMLKFGMTYHQAHMAFCRLLKGPGFEYTPRSIRRKS